MLIDDPELKFEYRSFPQTFHFSEFKSEFHRLLKTFSKDLSKEALIPIEKECVRFISQQRRRISYAVGQEIFGLKEQSLFSKHRNQKQLDARERIEQYLRDAAQSREADEGQNLAGQEQNSENDSLDGGELADFHGLKQLKKFLIESKAFEKLRRSVRELAGHQREPTSSVSDTAYRSAIKPFRELAEDTIRGQRRVSPC